MLRNPRSLVKVADQAILPISWESTSNSFYQADTFRCVLPLKSTQGLAWFGDQSTIEVEILTGFPSNPNQWTSGDLASVFVGRTDDIDIDPVARTVTLIGRDYTGALIDAKSSEKYQNQTASQIATTLAGKYGLTAVVTETTTKVGRYYQDDKGVRLQDENTEWDLLTWLAREEDFVCYVQGNELHFEHAPDETKAPVVFTYQPPGDAPATLNTQTIKLGRTLTVAGDIIVEVSSWASKSKSVIRQTATRKKKNHDGGTVQKYSYSIPNLTIDAAQQRAQAILADLTRHELKLSIGGPADYPAAVSKTDLIKLTGTDSAWDATYHPASIARSFDQYGYTWQIEAKNHAVESEPTL